MTEKSEHTLQSIILKLQNFWADQGCLIWQPYHTEVGAGTMNPATALRVLGPEPWWVAYVEPSFRPADGRYGENPNRWQHYYQFQVILKPDPGNPQELYLDSLLALGIDPEKHDIRFVEDNWETPMLGAWGLGWEVWLDGQEITQFTYFQQTGGQTLDPVSVELTYGLERILLALQGVDSFLELNYSDQLTYGEVKLRPEIEYCTYNFEEADVGKLEGLFDTYEAEAQRCIEAGLIQPAHDFVLKCSHTFNLLDARGAVGVTERAAIYSRVRKLAEGVARGYEEQRAEAGHPWMDRWVIDQAEAVGDNGSAQELEGPANFLLEIGTEELPDADLQTALEQLEEAVPNMLETARLGHESIEVYGTPRRLVLSIEGLAARQEDEVATVKGPPAERAFDEHGEPTSAATGFARSKGVEVDDLVVEEVDGGRYVMVEVRQAGRPAPEVLAEQLPILIDDLSFGREMRWNQSGVSFSRPIRWILSLHADQVVPFSYAGLAAGRTSRGLRFDDQAEWSVDDTQAYFEAIAARGIILDPEERQAEIKKQVEALAQEVGGEIIDDPALLREVTNLVEVPTALRGQFDEDFLQLPRPVLISVMRSHQRYFAVEKDGELLQYFITVRNGGDLHLDTVRAGNEQVLRARFADAAYFVERDLEQPLEAYLAQLKTLTFESSLGSMRDKVDRVEKLVDLVAGWLDLSPEEKEAASRAAHLSKADLATQMVVEMTSLQGEMGRIYALEAGEDEAVALAIAEHYLPRYAGDRVPASAAGLAVGLADRLDSLIGLFAAGMQPSGGGDPFALRRTAIGLIEALEAHQQSLDLRQALEAAAEGLPIAVDDETYQDTLAFIERRQRSLLLAAGHRHDVVRAVLAEQGHDPTAAKQAVLQLESWMERESWPTMLQNYARCVRITRDLDERYSFDPEAIEEPATQALWEVYQQEEAAEGFKGSIDQFFEALLPMLPAIEVFFDEVLVMAEDEAVKRNRLALLQRIAEMAEGTVDLSHVEGF